ncbi:MAG: thioredoxin family protein [Ktedonobacterales bacterium]
MAITRERFEQGLTYEQFKEQMTRNQERFIVNEQNFTPDAADVDAIKSLPQSVNVLVLVEDWCGDVIDNLPVLGRLAMTTGKFDIRVFLRDQNLDLMDQYLKDGQFRSIPVFAFLDDSFNKLGHFIERPESVTSRRAQQRAELYTQHPEFGSPETPITQLPEDVRVKLMEAQAPLREATKAQDNQDVVRAIREIVTPVRA